MAEELTGKLTPPIGNRDHWQGPKDAPVTFVEYGDFECPHCRQAHAIVKELRERLGDRFLYVFRHFPIRASHTHAQHAAEAAEAAAAQGKFWEMAELIFEHQDALEDADLVAYARELGLDEDRFRQDLEEHVHAERIRNDFLSGVRSGVNGTPTFFINGVRYDGAWDVDSLAAEIEKPLGVQIRNVFQRFTRLQASGGILLFLTTILALIWANSPMAANYFELFDTDLAFTLGSLSLKEHLLEWVNDGLMVIFFFVVGLEIKREITVGELTSPKRAALPIMAAVGGMLVPALIYLAFNAGGEAQSGWAIPMATDIAFTLGILTVFGKRIPLGLKVFFTALAIADDLGAVMVIALFYSEEILWTALLAGAVILVVLIALNRLGVRNPLPYAILGIGLWLAFLESGVHPTIAGVLLALTIPARTKIVSEAYLAQCNAVLGRIDDIEPEEEILLTDRQQAAARTLESIAERMQTPAQRLEHSVTPWATYLVLPIFALANAGVALSGDLVAGLTQPVSLGIIFGLVLGKSIGLTSFSWLAVKIGLAELPSRVTWAQLFSSTWLAGIGFTMSLFITSSAFESAALISSAKISILVASAIAGLVGSTLLLITTSTRAQVTELALAPATD